MKLASRKQLVNKLAMHGFDLVVKVEGVPEQVLLGRSCPDAEYIEEIELADGIQLAIVQDEVTPPLDKLARRLSEVEIVVSKHAYFCDIAAPPSYLLRLPAQS